VCSLVGTRKFQNLKIKTEISQENEIIQVAVAMNSIYVCICVLIGWFSVVFCPFASVIRNLFAANKISHFKKFRKVFVNIQMLAGSFYYGLTTLLADINF